MDPKSVQLFKYYIIILKSNMYIALIQFTPLQSLNKDHNQKNLFASYN